MRRPPVNKNDLWFDPEGMVRVTFMDYAANDIYLTPWSNCWDQFLPVWFIP